MEKFKIRRYTNHIIVFSQTLLIFITIPFFSKIWLSLGVTQQKLAVNVLYLCFLSAGIFFTFVIYRRKNYLFLRFGILLILSYCYVEMFLSLHRFPAERFHLAEYGVLSFFAFRLFAGENSGIAAIVKAFFYTFYISIIDEAIQWIVPGRVGTYEDIIINIKSAVLSLGVVAVVAFPLKTAVRVKAGSKEVKEIIFYCLIALILIGFFLYNVHEFGYEIRDRNLYFYSSLSKKHIADISEKLIKNKELIKDFEIKKALEEGNIKNLKGEKRDIAIFLSERYTHLIERDIALAKNKKEKALFEKEIIEKYYPLNSKTPLQENENKKTIKNQVYKSPVKSNIIVSFTKNQLVFICFFLGSALLILKYLI